MRFQTLITLALATPAALAGISPFTETFDTDNANWHDGPQNPAAWDAGGFISSSGDVNSAGAFGLLIFRAQTNFNSSGGAFNGDYVAGNIDTISFDIRHDAGQDLTFAVRFATATNSPAFVIFSPDPVASGVWTTLSLAIDPNSPFYAPAGGTYDAVANQVGTVQIIVNRPDGLTDPLQVGFDLDNVAITPAPGALAMLGLGGLVAARRRRA